MNEIKHWGNILKHLTSLDGEAANSFRMYYIQRCKQLSSEADLPKHQFSKSLMCEHCGSLWSKNKYQFKLNPGRACSKSVKQIIKSCNEHNVMSRFRATLMKKSLKNKKNKLVFKCSVCLRSTIINCNKPPKTKLKIEENNVSDTTILKKKKKKRIKDKTAGLNISIGQSPDVAKKEKKPLHSTPIVVKTKPMESNLTPLQKIKNINLNKLNKALNKKDSPRNSIQNFLKELY